MPLLLILPLLLVLVLASALAVPLGLWLRYRNGKARRRLVGWVVGANAWALAVSVALFALGAWMAGHWAAGALREAAIGLLVGVALGIAGLWWSRFETRPDGLYHTPNPWLALLLTAVVAGRIGVALWQGWERWHAPAGASAASIALQAGLFALAGLLLGHALATAWGLRARFRRWGRGVR